MAHGRRSAPYSADHGTPRRADRGLRGDRRHRARVDRRGHDGPGVPSRAALEPGLLPPSPGHLIVAVDTGRVAAPVAPTSHAQGAFLPLGLRDVQITGGFWADRQRLNRERTIPHGFAQLQAVGTLHNFRLAIDHASDGYRALGM